MSEIPQLIQRALFQHNDAKSLYVKQIPKGVISV